MATYESPSKRFFKSDEKTECPLLQKYEYQRNEVSMKKCKGIAYGNLKIYWEKVCRSKKSEW